MATIRNHNSRDCRRLRSLGYHLHSEKQRGMCWDIWWEDTAGRLGPAGQIYKHGWIIAREELKRRGLGQTNRGSR